LVVSTHHCTWSWMQSTESASMPICQMGCYRSITRWLSWVDDCLLTGPEAELMLLKQEIMKQGECEDDGEISEFVGCIIDRNRAERWLKLTQPALLQSLTDEFKITEA
jgi:hypothetical protein